MLYLQVIALPFCNTCDIVVLLMDARPRKRRAQALSPAGAAVDSGHGTDRKANKVAKTASHTYSCFNSSLPSDSSSVSCTCPIADLGNHVGVVCSPEVAQSYCPVAAVHCEEPKAKTKPLDSTLPSASKYYPSTRVPLDGWFQPCRYCRSWTAYSFTTAEGVELPVCRRCNQQLVNYYQMYIQTQVTQAHKLISGNSLSHVPQVPPMPQMQKQYQKPSHN